MWYLGQPKYPFSLHAGYNGPFNLFWRMVFVTQRTSHIDEDGEHGFVDGFGGRKVENVTWSAFRT